MFPEWMIKKMRRQIPNTPYGYSNWLFRKLEIICNNTTTKGRKALKLIRKAKKQRYPKMSEEKFQVQAEEILGITKNDRKRLRKSKNI